MKACQRILFFVNAFISFQFFPPPLSSACTELYYVIFSLRYIVVTPCEVHSKAIMVMFSLFS